MSSTATPDPSRQQHIRRLEAAVASLADRADPMPDDQVRAIVDATLARIAQERADRAARHEQRLASRTRSAVPSPQVAEFLAMINP